MQVDPLGPVGVTVLAQIAALLLTSVTARVFPGMRDSARRATLHLLAVIAMAIWWFPPRWQNMELISLALFVFFASVQVLVALVIFTAGQLLRELKE